MAAQQIEKDYIRNWQELQEKLSQMSSEALLVALESLEAPPEAFQNFAALFYKMNCFDRAWIKTVRQVGFQLTHRDSPDVMQALEAACKEESNTTDDNVVVRTLRRRLDEYRKRGVHLDGEPRKALNMLADATLELESNFIAPENPELERSFSTKDRLKDLYTILSIKQKEAEILGYENYVELALDGRLLTTKEEISNLHKQIAKRVKPLALEETKEEIFDVDLTQYLSLDGTLQGLFAISRVLFGIVVSEEPKPQGWHQDVRLFHVKDEESSKLLGSFYLDPFKRSTKTQTNFMGLMSGSTVFMNTNAEPPVWDNMPTPIEIEDVVSIFHEFGHVLQFLLADRKAGIGSDQVGLDVSEVMPHFMEHWVFEPSILQTLAHLSGTTISDEAILAAQKKRRKTKIYETLHRVFLGQLELELFSRTKDEEESLVAMQRRHAEEYIPHNLLPKSDLSPMLQLVEANAGQKRVGQYRYLLSELISASIFCKFKDADIRKQEQVRELGSKVKEQLLRPGVLVDGKKAMEVICGHQVRTDGYFNLYNL
jgi:Zn-dependent oligopeptidase